MEFIMIRFISLVVALFTMQCYFYSGAYSKSHRLLPVLLTGICIYDFYEMVLAFTHENHVFIILEQLLFVQMIYLALHYIFDFSHARIPLYLEVVGFGTLICSNIFILLQHTSDNPIFHYLYLVFVYVYSTIILIVTTIFSLTRRIKSKRERYIVGMIYLASLFLVIGISLRKIHTYGVPAMSICLICTCFIVLYLLRKGYLMDLSQELQENLFHNNNVPTILFDGEQQYLQANNMAKNHFVESYLQDFRNFTTEDKLLKYGKHFYRCYKKPIVSRNKVFGYIITLADVTEEQQAILSLSQEKMSVEEVARKKDNLLSLISHKMRSPLNVIIGMCDILLHNHTSDLNIDNSLESIKASGKELLSYVDEILISSGADASVLANDQSMQMGTSLLQEEHIEPTILFPKARVLVAEDILTNQEVFKNMVKPWQFTIDFVENGEQAIAAVKNHSYQLIFLDKMMPVLGGIDAAHIIHRICDTPLVLVTADNTDHLQTEYLHYGFSAYLSKPLSLASLKRIIETLMPVEFQEFSSDDEDGIFIPENDQNAVLELYCDELSSLSEKLVALIDTDLSLYRTTVHGIKSSSKQLGYMQIGEEAEVLEMAAKLENKDYIRKHTDDFITHCHDTVTQIKERI